MGPGVQNCRNQRSTMVQRAEAWTEAGFGGVVVGSITADAYVEFGAHETGEGRVLFVLV